MTFNVRGHKVRTESKRRFVVVAVRPNDVTRNVPSDFPQTYKAFARVEKRTDNFETAKTAARRYGFRTGGAFAVVVDTTTGQEVA